MLIKIKNKGLVSQCPKFTLCFANIPVTFRFTSGSNQIQSRVGRISLWISKQIQNPPTLPFNAATQFCRLSLYNGLVVCNCYEN